MFAKLYPTVLALAVLGQAMSPPHHLRIRREDSCVGASNREGYVFNCVPQGTPWEERQKSFPDGTYAIEPICGCNLGQATTEPELVRDLGDGDCVLVTAGNEFVGPCNLAPAHYQRVSNRERLRLAIC